MGKSPRGESRGRTGRVKFEWGSLISTFGSSAPCVLAPTAENVLLGMDGFLKLADFGMSKYIPSEPTTAGCRGSTKHTATICGTPEYLAPEIVAGLDTGPGVDW